MRFARFILKFEENHYQAVLKLINCVEKAHKRDIWAQMTNEINPSSISLERYHRSFVHHVLWHDAT